MKADERCGMCRFAQETADIETVECHYNPPATFPVPTPQGVGFAAAWPRVNALRGWCRCFEKGDMVRMSRVLPATSNALKLVGK